MWNVYYLQEICSIRRTDNIEFGRNFREVCEICGNLEVTYWNNECSVLHHDSAPLYTLLVRPVFLTETILTAILVSYLFHEHERVRHFLFFKKKLRIKKWKFNLADQIKMETIHVLKLVDGERLPKTLRSFETSSRLFVRGIIFWRI